MAVELSALLNKITSDVALDATIEVTNETELLLSGVVDSLGIISVVTWLEAELGVEIDPGEVVFENFETPAAIMAFVQSLT